jgi:hypothetical protein
MVKKIQYTIYRGINDGLRILSILQGVYHLNRLQLKLKKLIRRYLKPITTKQYKDLMSNILGNRQS